MKVEAWEMARGSGPMVACAIHCGHDVRPDSAVIDAVAARLDGSDLVPFGIALLPFRDPDGIQLELTAPL